MCPGVLCGRSADLSPSDSATFGDDVAPTLLLRAYSVNQKGRSEPMELDDIAINEAEKRTGKCVLADGATMGVLGVVALCFQCSDDLAMLNLANESRKMRPSLALRMDWLWK